MSTSLPDINSFIVENELFTDKEFSEFLLTFQDKYNDVIGALNKKDFGYYSDQVVLCGQLRFDRDDVQNEKNVYRLVIDFGALPNAALKSVAHGITLPANTEMTRIYGTASDQTAQSYLPLPYASATVPIELYIDATNVNIVTADDKTAYAVSTVTIEFLQE